MRSILLLTLTLVLPVAAASQEAGEPANPGYELNSITEMLMEHQPRLQPGFGSESDRWLLYSPQFDVLSAGLQKFLLQKYGYLSPHPAERTADRATPSFRREAVGVPLAPGTNVKVTISDAETGRRVQSEACIAVSGQNAVVGYNDSGGNERVSYSRDGGATWRETQLPPFPGFAVNVSDPVVAAGPDGRFYHAYLAPSVFGQIAVGVSRSDDGGANWSAPTNASGTFMSADNEHDKDWLAVDNVSGSPYRGNVYASWTTFTSNPTGSATSSIRFVRSSDGGRTWSNAIALTELSPDDAQARHVAQGSYIAVGPNGEVYVAWFDTRVSGLRVTKSVDGGVTFSDPVAALVRPSYGIHFLALSTGQFEIGIFPSMAVDTSAGPNRGTVYLTSEAPSPSGNLEVVVTRSTDGGRTWSDPVQVKNDAATTDRFQPDIAVADNGNVGVMFYDRRNDPENNSLMDVYIAISSDGGRSFPVNSRLTTTNWPVLPTNDGDRPGYHGDYNKVVASDNNFYAAWGDDRSGLDPDVYVAVIPATGVSADFVMASTRAYADVSPGGSATYNITTGGAAGLRLSAASLTPGLSFQFSGNALTVGTTQSTVPGTYTIQVKGASSEGLERATVVRLTVHSPQLARVPVAVTPLRTPAYVGQAAADRAGNIHLVTVEDSLSRVRKRISYRRIPAGRTDPEPSVTIFRADPDIRDQALSQARIAVDPAGQIYIVWRRSDLNGSTVMISLSPDGHDFSEPQEIAPGPLAFKSRPSIAVATDGTVFVSFIKQTVREVRPQRFTLVASDLYLTRSTDGGGTFSEPVNVSRYNSLSRTVLTSSAPSLALDSDNQPHLAWLSSQADIFYARSDDGGQTFTPVVNVSNSSDSANPVQPSLAVDGQKNVYIAWTNPDGDLNQEDIFLAKSTDGKQFNTIKNLSEGSFWTGSAADWPTLGVDAAGNLTAAWRELVPNPLKSNDPQHDMFYSRSSDGGLNWSPALNFTTNVGDTLLGGGLGTSSDPPGLLVSQDGRVSIFYDDDTSGGSQIWMFQLP